MQISSINNISFKGIKVNGREQKQTTETTPTRYAQKQVLDSWQKSLDMLNEQSNNLAKNSKIDIPFAPNGEYIPKDQYTQIISGVEEAKKLAEMRKSLGDKMWQVAEESIAKIKELDELDKKRGFVQDVYTARPSKNKGVDRVAGYEYEMQVLNEEFISKVQKEKGGKDVDIPGSILFFGPNGNGKTHITRAVAQASGCKIKKIDTGLEKSAEKTMQKIINTAEESEKRFKEDRIRTIIFVDELDRLINDKSPIKKEFEDFIKTCSEKYHCTLFAASNHPLNMGLNFDDTKVFPIKMSIEPPEGENIEKMFRYELKKYPTEDIDYTEITKEVEKQNDLTGNKINNGQIKLMCGDLWTTNERAINQQDLINMIRSTKPEIPFELVETFEKDKKVLIEG